MARVSEFIVGLKCPVFCVMSPRDKSMARDNHSCVFLFCTAANFFFKVEDSAAFFLGGWGVLRVFLFVVFGGGGGGQGMSSSSSVLQPTSWLRRLLCGVVFVVCFFGVSFLCVWCFLLFFL